MSDRKTALVPGATGGIGGETAALLRHGWQVVAMLRSNTGLAALANATRVGGDASIAADVVLPGTIYNHGPMRSRGWARVRRSIL